MLTLSTNKIEPHWHELTSQKGQEEPAKFKVYAVKGSVLDDVLFQADFSSGAPLTAKGVRTALINGIKGWENVTDSNGEPCEFTPQMLENLSWGDRNELAMAVVNKSQLDSKQEKNSDLG